MEVFSEFLAKLDNPQHRKRFEEIFNWIFVRFPNLTPKIAWNQPMFTDHGTFIIGFSASKKHMAIAPERVAMEHFSDDITQSGYEQTKELIRIPWDGTVDYPLLEKIIEFNIQDKAACTTFWRK